MDLTKAERAFVLTFATSLAGILIAGSVTGSATLYWAVVVLLLPWTLVLLPMIMPTYGLALLFSEPIRSAGYEGAADALAGYWTVVAVMAMYLCAAAAQGLLLVFASRAAQRRFARARNRYCRHARLA